MHSGERGVEENPLSRCSNLLVFVSFSMALVDLLHIQHSSSLKATILRNTNIEARSVISVLLIMNRLIREGINSKF